MVILGYQCDWAQFRRQVLEGITSLLNKQEAAGPGRIRLHVWRDGGGAYGPVSDNISWLLEYAILPVEYFEYPEPVTLSDFHGLSVQDSAISRIKTASALPYVLAARQARDAGTDDVVIFSEDGSVAETSASNLFILNKQTITTPPLTSGCLEGTMRNLVIEICQSLSLTVEEAPVSTKSLKKAEAVFLTNSIRGIRAVSEYGMTKWQQSSWRKVVFLQKSLLSVLSKAISDGESR